jgi:hypothetical protein
MITYKEFMVLKESGDPYDKNGLYNEANKNKHFHQGKDVEMFGEDGKVATIKTDKHEHQVYHRLPEGWKHHSTHNSNAEALASVKKILHP